MNITKSLLKPKTPFIAAILLIIILLIPQSCIDPCKYKYQTQCTLYKRIITSNNLDSAYIDSLNMYTRYHVACDMEEIELFNRNFFNSTVLFTEDSSRFFLFYGDTINRWTSECDCCSIY